MSDQRALLRHFMAALAYRAQKALRDAPPEFGDFRAAAGVRTPRQIVRHMSDVLGYARTRFTGGQWRAHSKPTLAEEVVRLHEILADLSDLAATTELDATTAQRLLQGPLADAMTHVGQLSMLRRMAGSPIPPENFFAADIEADNVGADQTPPREADREWYDAEDEPY